MAVVCALFLIANTMNTMVVEQGNEIAILRALGGRRRQIASVILRTAAALGAAGAIAGTALGIVVAYLLTRYLAAQFFSVHAGFAISAPVVVASLLAGPVLAVLTSLPGLRRAVRRPVADVLDNRTLLDYGTGRLDRILASARLLSGPTRMGVRNTLRRKRRTAATIAQVTVAVALAIALFAVGETVAAATAAVYDAQQFQIEVDAGNGAPPFGGRAISIAAATPGVTQCRAADREQRRTARAAVHRLRARAEHAVPLQAELRPVVHRGRHRDVGPRGRARAGGGPSRPRARRAATRRAHPGRPHPGDRSPASTA